MHSLQSKHMELKVLGWQPGEYYVATHGPMAELITLREQKIQKQKAAQDNHLRA
jgi:hypothetical protein